MARVGPVGSIPTRTSLKRTYTKIFCVIFLLESMDERMVESYNAQSNIIIIVRSVYFCFLVIPPNARMIILKNT